MKDTKDGCAFSTMYLYNLDAEVDIDETLKNIRKHRMIEPKAQPKQLNFKLSKSFKTAREVSHKNLLWFCKPMALGKDELHGYAMYEDAETNQLMLNFYRSDLNKSSQFLAEYQYPQTPLPQSWIIEYPLLAYKSFTPNNQEIIVLHLAAGMPHRWINLDGWEFVCFVNHT